mmetsp:Transcript_14384/g.23902  ORF Transcript_14384/g.23902 Transcript_14384/m.23902 type:complete len:153 (+) Transcript_14384:129-587(+)
MNRDTGQQYKDSSLVRSVLVSAQVVCTTSIGAGDNALQQLRFPFVLVDEATLVTEPTLLVHVVFGVSQLVLIGDPHQLAPLNLTGSSSSSGGGGGGDGEEDEQSAATTNTIGPGLIVVKTPYGGHLAYPGGFFPITAAWTDHIIVEWFRQFL